MATALQSVDIERAAEIPGEAVMRARYPDAEGFIERGGVKVGYEVFGAGEPAILLLTSWAIVHARQWKAQVPYLARRFRVIAAEGRGNGRADRPAVAEAYLDREYVDDAVAVLDAVGVDRAVVVGLSMGGRHALQLAAWYPERAAGVVAFGAALPWPIPPDFGVPKDSYEGWEKANQHYWLADYRGWVEFFMSQVFTEPHSTKQHEDGVAWGRETTAETLLLTGPGVAEPDAAAAEAVCRQVRCPVLIAHGDQDAVVPYETGAALARWTGGQLVTIHGGGHAPTMRDPVRANLVIRDFAESLGPSAPASRTWTRARDRRQRVLYVSSPIGLGHARRDLAIADELRLLRPGLEVHWLAQHPVTELLKRRGELIHPASAFLASESGHIESEATEHDLHAFQAIRNMDEILIANFMVFHDLVTSEDFDLWVGDEAWDVDYFLHENPELKRAPYAWMTDFVGWLPMPDGGDRERALTADYNSEMIEQIARFPSLRDRSVFVGNPDDVVPDAFGDGLPVIRDWVARNYKFSGYVSGISPGELDDRAALRAELGYRDGEQVCVVTVGGSGVGTDLLRRAVAAFPVAKRLVPGLRMIVAAGPRIDPGTLGSVPAQDGLEVRGYVHDLYRHLAACDLAVVQGGLTTTMELTASGRPFIYVPLRHHFEQNFHVRHRLARYGAGRCLDYEQTGPDELAAAMAEEISRPARYRPVETDGAARAAACLAELM
jgi:pimeloyl-ACP methyl ester carboxylesterase/predicted glycosyltransferase